MGRHIQIVIDAAHPGALAGFWAEALGYQVQPPPEGFDSWEAFLTDRGVPEEEWDSSSAVTDPDEAGPRIYFQRVPEAKAGKNRVHVDVEVGGGPGVPVEERRQRVAAESERLVAIGGSVLRPVDEHGHHWIVMQDPEGNEFCVH